MILFATETWPFGAALALMVALFVIEGVGLLLSASPSSLLDGFLPEVPDGASGALAWLHIGKVPALILLAIFLAGFAMTGFVLQSLIAALGLGMLPAWLASIPAVLAGVAGVSLFGGLFARFMPFLETVAVSEQSLIGRTGVVTEGVARIGMAAQAKVRDVHGRIHYVLVEPDLPDQDFQEGEAVLLVKKQGAKYRAIRNPRPDLL